MNCPNCHHPMHHHRFGEMAINECGRCGGIWFDAGQLDQLKEITDPDLRWLDIDFWKSRAEFEVTHHPLKSTHCQRVYLTSAHPEMDGRQLVPSQIWSRSRHAKNFTAGIWLIFRG